MRDVPTIARVERARAPHLEPTTDAFTNDVDAFLERALLQGCRCRRSQVDGIAHERVRGAPARTPFPIDSSEDTTDVADRVGDGVAVWSATGKVRAPQPRKVRGDGPLLAGVGDCRPHPIAPRREAGRVDHGSRHDRETVLRAGA